MQTINLEDVSYTIPYSQNVLKNINLRVSSGEFLGILGHNGSGKTTLMDILNGFRAATSGKVEILGENPHASNRRNKHQVVFLSQEVTLKSNIAIHEFLSFHSFFYPEYSLYDQKHLLEVFDLDPETKIGALSTGQQKKVQAVAGLAAKPKLILIDEITAVMDPETRAIFFNELQRVRKDYGSTILLATNIAEDLIERTDKVLFIANQTGSLHSPSAIMNLFNLEKAS